MKARSVVLAFVLLTTGLGSSSSSANESGLPSVPSGHRPGPDALYLPAPDLPMLQNTGPWQAPPLLVSGAVAYSSGEFLYQDHIYDDHGAQGTIDSGAPIGSSAHLFSPRAGTYTYPRSAVYANNAADLVEFRVKPLVGSTAFRVTLNTLIDPDLAAFTIALGGQDELVPIGVAWPYGAGVRSPATHFLTVHGTQATLLAAAGAPVQPMPTVTVDVTRRQFDVRISHSAWNPGNDTVRMTVGVGLWNQSTNSYLRPQAGSANASSPEAAPPPAWQ